MKLKRIAKTNTLNTNHETDAEETLQFHKQVKSKKNKKLNKNQKLRKKAKSSAILSRMGSMALYSVIGGFIIENFAFSFEIHEENITHPLLSRIRFRLANSLQKET